jgi:hypothetical protein
MSASTAPKWDSLSDAGEFQPRVDSAAGGGSSVRSGNPIRSTEAPAFDYGREFRPQATDLDSDRDRNKVVELSGSLGRIAMSEELMMARRSAREYLRSVQADALKKLIEERNHLLQKKALGAGNFTSDDSRRLRYIRWQMDRFDDAMNGESLDTIEMVLNRYEELAGNLRATLETLTAAKGRNG